MPNTQHELIPIAKKGDSEQTVDARLLHKFLESESRFNDWIFRKIEDFGFVEGRDFYSNLSKSTGGRQAIEYTLTLDMAKELSMLERNEKGKQARQYFIAAEKQLRHLQTHLLTGYDEISGLLSVCDKVTHDGHIWYAANMLRRIAGKTTSGGHQGKLTKLAALGLAAKLPEGQQMRWYVRYDAVDQILCVKLNTIVSVSMVKLLTHQSKGGTQ